MRGRNGDASWRAGVAGRLESKADLDSILGNRGQQYADDQASKWAAVMAYSYGLLSRETVSGMFAYHHHWRPL